MATNFFFQNYDYFNEQQLIEDLVIESIQIYGLDTVYITRSIQEEDFILNEDDLSIFDEAYEIDMYVKSVDGFEGEGDFLSRFGLQIRDSVTFTVAIRTFERFVTRHQPLKVRPLEGDLVFMPMNGKFFKVMHVEHESIFYQSGALQVFDIKCELFEYSNERFETGRPLIDNFYDNIKTDRIGDLVTLKQADPIARNIDFEREGNGFIDFTEIDPFSEVITNPRTNAASADSTIITADNAAITTDIV
jgi:hypothetical protein